MFTGLGQIVGTLEYMSPEQAKVNQLDIDTPHGGTPTDGEPLCQQEGQAATGHVLAGVTPGTVVGQHVPRNKGSQSFHQGHVPADALLKLIDTPLRRVPGPPANKAATSLRERDTGERGRRGRDLPDREAAVQLLRTGEAGGKTACESA